MLFLFILISVICLSVGSIIGSLFPPLWNWKNI